MPIFRTKSNTDSVPDDDPMTRKIDRSEIGSEPVTTPNIGGGPLGYDDPAIIPDVQKDESDMPIGEYDDEEPKTRVMFPGQKAQQRKQKVVEQEQDEGDKAMDDPVVGWLVVVDGPGRGHASALGYGMNSIGRASTERISLDYGDTDMSRTKHTLITYDPRGRKFYLQHGGGQNLTYLKNGSPVLTPVEINGGEEIIVGQTTLRFVPFCGELFDWQDQSNS